MDFLAFLKVLVRRIWLLGLLTVTAVFAVLLFTTNQPKTYKSFVTLSMGLSGGVTLDENVKLYVAMRQANNMLELARSRTVYERVGMRLLYHDLTSVTPFRSVSYKPNKYTVEMEQKGVALLNQIFSRADTVRLTNEQINLVRKLLSVRGYDFQSLLKGFSIYQLSESDFMRIVFKAENPDLVVFALEQMTTAFIKKYQELVSSESSRSRIFFENQVQWILKKLKEKENQLEKFKEEHHIINLDEQIRSVVAQLEG